MTGGESRRHARTLMVQGTGSHVGKSVLVAALCRIFLRKGLRVAPFKAQNMSNNSFVTPDGLEIGRAQAVQAEACRLPARSDFNPVLIKPSGEREAQLVVDGVVEGRLVAADFGRLRRDCADRVRAAFARLSAEFEMIVLEGAGSPAEVNLRDHDIVNMWMAREAVAPVLLVGDIDRGGVLASLVGTMELLTAEERRHVKGFLVNKFRGDVELLKPGLVEVERRIGVPCLGVIPFCRDVGLPEEDALAWDMLQRPKPARADCLTVGVVDVPCISNFTDFDALGREPDVRIVRVTGASADVPDVLIFPGTKHTAQALHFVRNNGVDRLAERVIAERGTVVGLCGGYQILGTVLQDPHRVESDKLELPGLGLLPVETVFARKKVTVLARGRHLRTGCPVQGYEVHMGDTRGRPGAEPLLELDGPEGQGLRVEGAVARDGQVMGTYLHGLFDAAPFRREWLNSIRQQRGWPPLPVGPYASLDRDLDLFADFVGRHLDLAAVETIVQKGL